MKRILFFIFAVLLLFSCQRDLSEFDYLVQPQIIYKQAQKMLVVEMKGDPNVVGKDAFKQLFKTFFTLKKQFKDIQMAPPRARWALSVDTPADEWVGLYALPISKSVDQIPELKGISHNARIETWYGCDITEILHIGAYMDETPTIEKLKAFINERGYEISGDHEEEYLKGPGMFFKGNPKKYRTIIRYEIVKNHGT